MQLRNRPTTAYQGVEGAGFRVMLEPRLRLPRHERGQPEPGRASRRVRDALPEEGGEEDQAQRDGHAVQVELGRREGQFVAESLRWAVTVTFPAANSPMAKHGKAQFGTHKFYTRIAVPPCSNLI